MPALANRMGRSPAAKRARPSARRRGPRRLAWLAAGVSMACVAFVLGGCGGASAPMKGGAGPGGDASLDTVDQAEAALAQAEARIGGMTGAGDAAGAMTHSPSAEPGTTQLGASPQNDQPAPPESRCETACGALGSMRRAADRVCELAPGDRCESAHARVVTAEKRVSDSCPECSA